MRSSRVAGRVLLAFLVALITVALLGGLLTGCSSAPASGTVTARHYSAPYDWTQMMCASYGKYGCQVYMPVQEHQDASWSITLTNGQQTGDVDVDERTWDRIRVGDHYP